MDSGKKPTGKIILSVIYLLAAAGLLIGVCGYCYPALEQRVRQAIAGDGDSPVREAFGVLADGLGEGKPVKDTLAESYGVLTGDAP